MTTSDESALNLIHNNIIKSNKISDKGWFSDHSKWNHFINCFNNKWSLCHKVSTNGWRTLRPITCLVLNLKFSRNLVCLLLWQVFSTKCKSDGIRAMYEFIPIREDIELHNIVISLRATAQQLIEQVHHSFRYSLHNYYYFIYYLFDIYINCFDFRAMNHFMEC
jgi:hypothetical protein